MSTATANPYGGTSIQMPMDLIRLSIDQRVYVKLKGERELRGKLYAYDQHLNMVLGDVEETHTSIEVDEETLEESITPIKRTMEVLFVRGDGVLLIAPPVRA